MPPPRLILDLDTGIDDALALLYALGRSDADLVAIGTVAGNVALARCTENTLRVLELKGRADVLVAEGCARPLAQPLHDAAHVHGDDGLGNTGLPSPGLRPSGEHAVDQLIRLAAGAPGELTLVATGPLTNVAVAVTRQPQLTRTLREVIWMGGAFAHPGNVTPAAEFNAWVDPEAAKVVLEAGFRLTIVPLDASMQAQLTRAHLGRLPAGPVPDFVRAVTQHYVEHAEMRGHPGAAMHDPLAVAVAIDPSLVTRAEEIPATVETAGRWTRGMTLGDRRGFTDEDTPPGRARVVYDTDVPRFFGALLEALA